VEWPRALPRALAFRVTHPYVRELVSLPVHARPHGGTVSPAPTGAEPFHCHVSGGENHVDGVSLGALGCELLDLIGGE